MGGTREKLITKMKEAGIGGTLLRNNEFGSILQKTVKEIDIEYIVVESDDHTFVRPAQNIFLRKNGKRREILH